MSISLFLITKASGERQLFSEEKLRKSLERSKADPETISEVVSAVESRLREGMTTKELYELAYATLRAKRRGIAARYSLKRAIMALGPDGHPFERYVSELLKHDGYTTQVSQIVSGACVAHEVDVIAEKNGEHHMVECKFHNLSGTKSDIKVALYVKARFEDLRATFQRGWLVTNTGLTGDAIQYAECAGLIAIGWNYPQGAGLGTWVEASKLFPITCLTSLSTSQKRQLLDRGCVLCLELASDKNTLNSIGLNTGEREALLAEIENLFK